MKIKINSKTNGLTAFRLFQRIEETSIAELLGDQETISSGPGSYHFVCKLKNIIFLLENLSDSQRQYTPTDTYVSINKYTGNDG